MKIKKGTKRAKFIGWLVIIAALLIITLPFIAIGVGIGYYIWG